MDDILSRTLNPVVLLTMMAAGLAYSRFLWALNLRPTLTLIVTGIVPGAVYLLTVWAIRALQGTASLLYIALIVDWFIFSGTAVLAVLIARRRHE